jgi:hypothetical protein
MLIPTIKSPRIDNHLKATFGVNREQAILDEVCVSAPIGCGMPVTKFRTNADAKEFEISGLCQSCQDDLFEEAKIEKWCFDADVGEY